MSDWSIDNIRTKLAELKLREKLLKKDAEILKAELVTMKPVMTAGCTHANKSKTNIVLWRSVSFSD